MRVYITKYALSGGIFTASANRHADDDMISIRRPNTTCDEYFHGDDWHETREAAVEKANAMRLRKIASLRMQIAKLEAMTFEEKN